MSVYSKLTNEIVDFGTAKTYGKRTPSKLTIHHMAAVNADPVAVAKSHRDSDRQASANYYIGSDGKIVGGLSEDLGPWTSSNKANDLMAITFEVANSSGEPDWKISDAAYKAVIALAADICKRYRITPHYNADPSGGTLTLHCQFAATACPGPYLKGKHQDGSVERDIIKAMGKAASPEEQIWDYLMAHIGNACGVAGLMGNMQAESGLRSNNLQNSFEKKLGFTDETYTAAVDCGGYGNFENDKAGYGLCQWTSQGRKKGLLDSKRATGKSIADLSLQLDWLWTELTGPYKNVLNRLKSAKTVYEASTIVLTQFECPADQSEAVKQKRASYSQYFYDKYSGRPGPSPAPLLPYIVRITADELNVREGPGTQYPIVQTVHEKEAFTIVREQDGWGFLKSGVGWICLEYTERV